MIPKIVGSAFWTYFYQGTWEVLQRCAVEAHIFLKQSTILKNLLQWSQSWTFLMIALLV